MAQPELRKSPAGQVQECSQRVCVTAAPHGTGRVSGYNLCGDQTSCDSQQVFLANALSFSFSLLECSAHVTTLTCHTRGAELLVETI